LTFAPPSSCSHVSIQPGGGSLFTCSTRRSSNAFSSLDTYSTIKRLNLNDAFIKHPEAKIIVRAAGDALQGGIAECDVSLLIRSHRAARFDVRQQSARKNQSRMHPEVDPLRCASCDSAKL